MNAFIDIHALQTVPPSNLNRDETGRPKTAIFGGVVRQRVSSQAWKRAIRKDFEEFLPADQLGMRTRRVVDEVIRHAEKFEPDVDRDKIEERVIEAFKTLKWSLKKEDLKDDAADESASAQLAPRARSGYLAFLSEHQFDKLAQLVLGQEEGEKIAKSALEKALNTDHSVDIALFGRMIADVPDFNVDAACQVAHAISVHEAELESDYFTAVDDAIEDAGDETGAAMIGTVELTSSTLYRYATIDLAGLTTNLGVRAAAVKAAISFVRAFIESMPTGKQNTFANRTVPDAIVVRVRTDRPVSLVNAFEDSVSSAEGVGRRQQALSLLAGEALDIDQAYGAEPAASYVVALGTLSVPEALGERVTVPELLSRLESELDQLQA